MYNFEPYNVLLAMSTNIAVLLMTASVLQGHITHIKRCVSVSLSLRTPAGEVCSRAVGQRSRQGAEELQ